MAGVRVYQLAKELKVQSALILELLDRLGREVRSDLSALDAETADLVRKSLTAAIQAERRKIEETRHVVETESAESAAEPPSSSAEAEPQATTEPPPPFEAGFDAAWQESGGRLVAGLVSPTNVAVPDADSRRDVRILSLAGSQRYEGPGSLLGPMCRTFYRQTAGHYPAFRSLLDPDWMLEAAVEGLGVHAGHRLPEGGAGRGGRGAGPARRARAPGGLPAAAGRRLSPAPGPALRDRALRGWLRSNPKATPAARRQLVVAHEPEPQRRAAGARVHLLLARLDLPPALRGRPA